MNTREQAHKVLRDAEAALRDLKEAGLHEQRYTDIAEVAQLADGLARLLSLAPTFGMSTTAKLTSAPDSVAITPRVSRPPASRTASRKKTKAKYPHFEREGNRLVKVGWSKKHREEYEHRAPRDAVAAFARHLGGTVPEGHVFVVEDLLPVPGVNEDDEVPAYQVYLTLKWLQDIGAVEKKGRDGYVLRNGVLSEGGIDRYWSALRARKV